MPLRCVQLSRKHVLGRRVSETREASPPSKREEEKKSVAEQVQNEGVTLRACNLSITGKRKF